MKFLTLGLGQIIQVRMADTVEMKIFEKMEQFFDSADEVETVKKKITFETPLYEYKFKEIVFTLLFDEMIDETVISIDANEDYKQIIQLIESIE